MRGGDGAGVEFDQRALPSPADMELMRFRAVEPAYPFAGVSRSNPDPTSASPPTLLRSAPLFGGGTPPSAAVPPVPFEGGGTFEPGEAADETDLSADEPEAPAPLPIAFALVAEPPAAAPAAPPAPKDAT